jgi:hypothetical protein
MSGTARLAGIAAQAGNVEPVVRPEPVVCRSTGPGPLAGR